MRVEGEGNGEAYTFDQQMEGNFQPSTRGIEVILRNILPKESLELLEPSAPIYPSVADGEVIERVRHNLFDNAVQSHSTSESPELQS